MIFQFPFPVPPSDVPLDPPGIVSQLFTCLFVVCLWLEMAVMVLPERWRGKFVHYSFRWMARMREIDGE